jgi:DNA-binding SARP family transcriptional activator
VDPVPTAKPLAQIFMLGRFAVSLPTGEVPSTTWTKRRPVELLTALALATGHVLHREELIDRFWPDKDLEAGANNLYRAVHDLRKIVGDEVVTSARGVVSLCDDVWIDVDAFERLVRDGDPASLQRALTLYQGSLLPDNPYEESLDARRASMRQGFIDASLRLVGHFQKNADPEQLSPGEEVAVLRRLLDVEPCVERAHRLLMEALTQAGRHGEAQQQYAECVRVLRERLDTDPSRETHDLWTRLRDGRTGDAQKPTAGTPTPSAAPTTPAARAEAWRRLARRFVNADDPAPLRGRPGLAPQLDAFVSRGSGALLVIGEAGVGKTRVALDCAARAHARGAHVMAGVGYDFEGTAPFTPFVDAWNDYRRRTGASPDDNPFIAFQPSGGSAQEDRLRLFQSVENALLEVAGDGSVCLVLEDIHQADESSLQLFHHLARAAGDLRLMLVATLRGEEVRVGQALHRLLGGLNRERLVERIELTRLDREGTIAIITDVLGSEPDSDVVDAIYRLSEGNPFYTEEIVHALRSDPSLAKLPDNVVSTVLERVARLGRETESLLVTASVIGRYFDFDVLRDAMGLHTTAALDALERGIEGRLVEESGGRYRFRHALIRESLYSSLTHARRVYSHRAVAKALEESGPNDDHAEILAFHHQAAGQLDRALPCLLSASKRAQQRLGFGEAVSFLVQAIELMGNIGQEPDSAHFDALLALGSMRVALGDLDDAVADLQAAAALKNRTTGWQPGDAQRARALRLSALALIERGDLNGAETDLDEALALLRRDNSPSEMSSLYYLYSQLRWHQDRHQDAYGLAEKCLVEAEKLDDPYAVARGYEMLALACHSLGEWRKGTEFEERRRNLAEGGLDVASAFDVHL